MARDVERVWVGIGNRDAGILYCVKRGYKILINVALSMQKEGKVHWCSISRRQCVACCCFLNRKVKGQGYKITSTTCDLTFSDQLDSEMADECSVYPRRTVVRRLVYQNDGGVRVGAVRPRFC